MHKARAAKDETAIILTGTHGMGNVYHETRPVNNRTVESVQISKVSFCEDCAEDLRKVPAQGYERRTQIDIVFEKVLTHVDTEIKPCPHALRGAGPRVLPRGVLRPPAVRCGHQGLRTQPAPRPDGLAQARATVDPDPDRPGDLRLNLLSHWV